MAVIPGVTVDFTLSPRIITIPVSGAPVGVSIADLQDTLQDIEDNEQDGILYPRLRDCSGGESLSGGRFVGYTMKLNNAQVMFASQTSPIATGSATQEDLSGKILTDLTATFITSGVHRGHKVTNWASHAMSVVTEVISETQLRHAVLSGGSRSTWLVGDEYCVHPIVKCVITSGNLTAVDGLGADLEPLMGSVGVFAKQESSTSAALIGMEGVAGDVADAVWVHGGRTLTSAPPIGVLKNTELPNNRGTDSISLDRLCSCLRSIGPSESACTGQGLAIGVRHRVSGAAAGTSTAGPRGVLGLPSRGHQLFPRTRSGASTSWIWG